MSGQTTRPRWLECLAAAGKAAAYLGLFLGWQTVISMAYSAWITVWMMLESPNGFDYALVYEILLARSSEISLISGLLTLATLAVIFKIRRKHMRREVWLCPVAGSVVGWAVGLAFCLYWCVTLLLSLVPEQWMRDYAQASAVLEETGVISVLSTVLVGPIVEEIIFRGLIFTRLRRVFSGKAAIVLSAAVFGYCHGDFVWFCYAFVLGMIFAWTMECSGSILPAMVMHIVFNGTNELLMLLANWEPGSWFYLLIFMLGSAGTIFCALHLRGALGQRAVPAGEPVAADLADERQPFAVYTEASADPARPGRVCWDSDSGPHHKFPPNRL